MAFYGYTGNVSHFPAPYVSADVDSFLFFVCSGSRKECTLVR